jgi:hypothetical protein
MRLQCLSVMALQRLTYMPRFRSHRIPCNALEEVVVGRLEQYLFALRHSKYIVLLKRSSLRANMSGF